MSETPTTPMSLDAEESVLGAMMLTVRAIDAVTDVGLQGRDFYRPSHGLIYDAILSLYADGSPSDAITVVARLEDTRKLKDAGGPEHIHELAALVPAAGNAAHYAKIVRNHAIRRSLIRAGVDIRTLGYEGEAIEPSDLIEQAEKHIYDLALSGRVSDWTPLSDAVASTYRRLEELYDRGDEVIGVPSGFRQLDDLTSGFQPGNLIVLAARPSMGKSALALGIAQYVAVGHGKPVGLFTLEMSTFEVTQRLLSSEGMVDSRHLRNGRLKSEDWANVTAAASRLHHAPLQIDDSTTTTMEIRAKARRLKMRNPDLSLLIVDYLQLMSFGGKTENRVQDVSQTSRALKVLAAELEVPVIALSQLNRDVEQRHDKRPILSDLRESGSIEQDADLVMFVYRDEYYHPEDTDQQGIAEVNLAKHRNGPTGTIKLAFVKRFARFGELATSAP